MPCDESDDMTFIDKRLAEEAKLFCFSTAQAVPPHPHENLSKVPSLPKEADQAGNSSSGEENEVEWRRNPLPSSQSLREPSIQEDIPHATFSQSFVNIPTRGLIDLSSDLEDEEDEESFFENPDISPEKLKALRMKRFESFGGGWSTPSGGSSEITSNSPLSHPLTSHSHLKTEARRPVDDDLHSDVRVGVSLLDDEDSVSGDDGDTATRNQTNPTHTSPNCHHAPHCKAHLATIAADCCRGIMGPGSPSATAWMSTTSG